jgi:hypothetical protein
LVGWKIDAGKAAQRARIVERLLGAGVGEVESMLQKVDAQHDRQADWLAAVTRFEIIRPDQSF